MTTRASAMLKKTFPNFRNGKGVKKSFITIRERGSEAFVPGKDGNSNSRSPLMYVYNTQCIIYIYIYSIMLHGGEMGEIGESMCFELRCAEECQFRDSWLDTLYS